MAPYDHMNYVEIGRAVLRDQSATKATKATKVELEAVWEAGGWLVISERGVRAVRVPAVLSAWVRQHEVEVRQALLGPGGQSP